jgi:glycosyltransferase involved in cell wall biosynthesis
LKNSRNNYNYFFSNRDLDIYHSPFHEIPAVIKNKKIKKFQTIYDLIPVLHPEFFEFKEDHLIKGVLDSLNRDTFVLCISESTKNDLCSYSDKIDPEKVFVVPLAASENFYRCTDTATIAAARSKYGIPPMARYFLSVSTLEPRKNIDQTIKAFIKILQEQKADDLYLVLTGTKGWDYGRIFSEIANSIDFKERIILTGYVPDEDLAPLYSGALGFVYPSFYEGFGLPPLEAMQCGTPVITSNTSSLPEVVGDAGIMVAPTDLDALCQAMLDLFQDEELRRTMSERSLARAKQFSWEKYTQDVINAYKTALGR